MSHLSPSQSQIEMEDKPIGRLSRAQALLASPFTPSQHQPPSFPGTGHTLDTEGRVLPNEGRIQDVGRAHFQAMTNMDGSDSHIQSPPAASSTTPAIDPEEHMKSSVFLHPKTKKRTWPLLPVACGRWSKEEYDFSFKKVVEYLKDAVDYHEKLRDSARNIHYKLMMVGLSLESAKPSVLVLCNYTDWGSLNSLLKKMPSQEYNCMIPSTWDRVHKFRFRDGGLSRMSSLRPILWLYLCPTSFETLKRLNGVPVSIECSSLVTMCGSLVEFEGRQSTISLTVDIDGQECLLTVEHIFQGSELENDKPQMSLDQESLASIEANIEQWDCLSDSEDDDTLMGLDTDWDLNYDDTQMDRKLPTTSVNYNPSQVSHEPTRATVKPCVRLSQSHKQGERVEPPNRLPHQSPYLDWACLSLWEWAPRQRYNFLLRPGKPPGPLEDVATKPRTHAVPVFMISGILGVRSGRLTESLSYLGSCKGQNLCETWTILLDQQEGFQPGESGSIVVDQETLKIYGHLVGSDMFGHGHVVPFSRTIKQIKTAFNVDNARLPTLENSGSHQKGSHKKGDIDDMDDEVLPLLLLTRLPNISTVQRVIEWGADVNRADTDGETPLWRAASGGHLAIVELLLENGADLSVPNKSGETPLCIAVENGHLPIAKLLLSLGSEVNCKDEHNRTPLLRAAAEGHQAIVELLIERGADVNKPDTNGETALSRAIQKGHRRIVEVLLEAGVDINVSNNDGQTPLQWAATEGYYDIVELLRKAGAEVNTTDHVVRVALLSNAIKEGNLDITQQLIEAGAEVNVGDKNGDMPLLIAMRYGHSDIIQQLLRAGAEVNVRDESGCTPLLIATRYGESDIVQQLIKAGARVNVRSKDGLTPLIAAVENHDKISVQKLLSTGAVLDIKDNEGRTALFIAVQKRNKGIIKMLIEEGAATDVEDDNGQNLLTLAKEREVDLSMYLA